MYGVLQMPCYAESGELLPFCGCEQRQAGRCDEGIFEGAGRGKNNRYGLREITPILHHGRNTHHRSQNHRPHPTLFTVKTSVGISKLPCFGSWGFCGQCDFTASACLIWAYARLIRTTRYRAICVDCLYMLSRSAYRGWIPPKPPRLTNF